MNRSSCKVRRGGLEYAMLILLYTGPMALAEAEEISGFEQQTVAGEAELDAMRGMNGDTSIAVRTEQNLNAAVTGSSFSAGTINGGSVTIAEHALDNFSGIGLFNIVTGNNNAVDSAVGVTFNLQ